ncbi:MAG: PTS sugar transporter subunit IIB [Propionibacteriaceae bacterium]|nr:PTS sugar transporter subunit IIB [Micropruina sp.]HBX82490.1 PTS sugar transporter subunit IIB [Propionibacteriaceae bacterium]HBY24633.1 PTS sugar transporter subunit IIB [Propionibacteriaceae bacterium]
MKVLLVCAAGMSTSLLTNNMKKNADADDVIDAVPVNELEHNITKYDVVLLGPQIKFKLKDVEKVAIPLGVPVAVIDMRAYGMMDGKAAMAQARALLAAK